MTLQLSMCSSVESLICENIAEKTSLSKKLQIKVIFLLWTNLELVKLYCFIGNRDGDKEATGLCEALTRVKLSMKFPRPPPPLNNFPKCLQAVCV